MIATMLNSMQRCQLAAEGAALKAGRQFSRYTRMRYFTTHPDHAEHVTEERRHRLRLAASFNAHT